MRWKDKAPPAQGDWRVVKRFLLWPLKLPIYQSVEYETRFFEMVEICQEWNWVLGIWEDRCWAYDPSDYHVSPPVYNQGEGPLF